MPDKIKTLLLTIFLIVTLSSCGSSFPKNEPELGIDIASSQLNTAIKVTAPKSANSYKLDAPLVLEVVNFSDQKLELRIDDIQIFRIIDEYWQKESYSKPIIVDDLFVEQDEAGVATSLTLDPNGVFPGYKRAIPIFLNVKSDKPVYLRIYIFAYAEDSEDEHQSVVAAFVDVSLIP